MLGTLTISIPRQRSSSNIQSGMTSWSATGKNDLDLIEPERAASSYDGHRLSEAGMMRIVNR
jgi:hypothetical protein